MDNDFATGYALGSDSGNTNNGSGMWGGDGSWIETALPSVLTEKEL